MLPDRACPSLALRPLRGKRVCRAGAANVIAAGCKQCLTLYGVRR